MSTLSGFDQLLFEEANHDIDSLDAIVHLEYDALPPLTQVAEEHGGGQWTRFVCISDTHSQQFPVPDGDVLLHSGDLTHVGKRGEMEKTMEWIYGLPHAVKIVIAGNHDLTLHRDWYKAQWKGWHSEKQNVASIYDLMTGERARASGVVYLENEKATVRVAPDRREWSVYGSPWSPEFCHWAFNYDRQDAEDIISRYENTDILLTHGPPHNILDQVRSGEPVGCETLAEQIAQGRLRPRLHTFGHIHEAHGAYIHSWESPERCEAPHVQNDVNYRLELSLSDDEDEVEEVERARVVAERCQRLARERNGKPGLGRTVFVNAANEPYGRNARTRDGRKVGHGGPGFRPVVVDLKDDIVTPKI